MIGTALPERATRQETGQHRYHTGGVAAIMARELALAGNQVTLLTAASPGAHAAKLGENLRALGITPVIVPQITADRREPGVNILTNNGNPIRAVGHWPKLASMAPQVTTLTREHEWTLISLNITPEDRIAALRLAEHLAVNATTKNLATQAVALKGQRLLTMNQQEMQAIMARARAGQSLHDATGATTTMVTNGARGRVIHDAGKSPRAAAAVRVPPGTDYIGAGDAATAGLVHAMAHKLDQDETVDRFITDLLGQERRWLHRRPLTG